MQEYLDIKISRDQLHASLGEGIPTGSLILIEGKDGSGKSIFGQRLMYAMLEKDVSITYISTELSTKDFIDQMASVDYAIDEYLLDNKLLFIPLFPFHGGVRLRSDFIERLMAAESLYDNDVIIIDAFSFLLVKEDITEESVFEVVKFFKKLTNKNKTILLTCDPGHLNQDLLTLLRNTCDVYFELGSKVLAGEERKFIKINRFKKAKGVITTVIAFRIEPGAGFVIEIAALA